VPRSRCSHSGRGANIRRPLRKPIVYVLVAAVVAASIYTARLCFFLYRVESASMEPALHCAAAPHCLRLDHDYAVVKRLAYTLGDVRRGDIAAFRLPEVARGGCGRGRVLLKRVVALPGESVRQTDSRVYVDGDPLREPYLQAPSRGADFGPVTVPAGRYFVLGDNRRMSCDSRTLGPIPAADVTGKVELIYSPPSSLRRP